ncbi:hypothetical protein [Polyangium sp. y55x31]|uniref:hypothetical protein n=1 Tax=Polyangium sp. y55x31 TaxID=3042688 RepID=UPI002482A5F2|nr:hypothetical protein [Polyangium sp. y55x31]MDI1476878.1 hypothetical protein [Polyangium sp. y55x31]
MKTFATTVTILSLGALANCAQILGTDDLEPCEADRCGEDPSSGGSSSSGSGGDDDGGAPCGAADVELTVHVTGSIKIELDGTDIDFEYGHPGLACVPKGTTTLRAFCDQSGGSDPEIVVAWGHDDCPTDATTCALDLQDDTTLTVVAKDPCL